MTYYLTWVKRKIDVCPAQSFNHDLLEQKKYKRQQVLKKGS